jgi:hypothetical protein
MFWVTRIGASLICGVIRQQDHESTGNVLHVRRGSHVAGTCSSVVFLSIRRRCGAGSAQEPSYCSRDTHNSKKSEDDEFLRAVIVMMAAQHSQIGRVQFFGKFIRAVRRTPHAYRSFFEDHGTVAMRTQHAMRIDRARFDHCVGHLARALFFHTFGTKWLFPITSASPNFFSGVSGDSVVPDSRTVEAVTATRQVLGAEPVLGDNPDVFKYRLRYDANEDAYIFAAVFYDVFEVFSYSSGELSQVAV